MKPTKLLPKRLKPITDKQFGEFCVNYFEGKYDYKDTSKIPRSEESINNA